MSCVVHVHQYFALLQYPAYILHICNWKTIISCFVFIPQATVEPVVYAALSASQPRKKVNTTATVDQHQVTYATVDVNATRKQEAKAATLPTSPTSESGCVIGLWVIVNIFGSMLKMYFSASVPGSFDLEISCKLWFFSFRVIKKKCAYSVVCSW